MQSPSNPISDRLVISYLTLRKCVGMLGVLLPFVLYLGCLLFYHCGVVGPSISQYYYSAFGSVFVGTLSAVAVFLFTYNGYDKYDKLLTDCAAVFALGAAFFPTELVTATSCAACTTNHTNGGNVFNIIHQISAGLFFVSLGVMSIFQFTKSKGPVTNEKLMRNRVYRVCGFIMIGAVALMLIYRIPAIRAAFYNYRPIFFLETIGLMAFGLSWLVKGEFILEDE